MKPLLSNDFHQNSCYTQIAHVEQQSPQELYTPQSRQYVLILLLNDIIKLETASPLPSVHHCHIKHDEDAEPSTSNTHHVSQLPEGCLGTWALYFLPGVIKLQGACLKVWNPNNITMVSNLQKLWDFNYGQSVKHNIIVGNPVFKGV